MIFRAVPVQTSRHGDTEHYTKGYEYAVGDLPLPKGRRANHLDRMHYAIGALDHNVELAHIYQSVPVGSEMEKSALADSRYSSRASHALAGSRVGISSLRGYAPSRFRYRAFPSRTLSNDIIRTLAVDPCRTFR